VRPTTSLPVADAGASTTPHPGVTRPAAGTAAGQTGGRGLLGRVRDVVGPYVVLTKPRVVELLLVTTVPTMLLAEGGWPSLGLVLATLVGGALAAGSANVLNCYIDRDIDQVMNRTRRRPTARSARAPLSRSASRWAS
jgi:heme o synthase